MKNVKAWYSSWFGHGAGFCTAAIIFTEGTGKTLAIAGLALFTVLLSVIWGCYDE